MKALLTILILAAATSAQEPPRVYLNTAYPDTSAYPIYHVRQDCAGYHTRRILVRNNLFHDIGGSAWGGNGRLFQVIGPVDDLTIEHNTGLATGHVIAASAAPSSGFVFRNNIAWHNLYGVKGDGQPTGTATLNAYFPGCVFAGNALIGGFQDYANDNYRVDVDGPYGRLGADVDGIERAVKGSL